jgi:hypothetical protein
VSYKCPVCKKEWKDSMQVARHMFGTGDKPHKEWVDEQGKDKGFTFIDLMIEQATTPGNKSYVTLAEIIEKAQGSI